MKLPFKLIAILVVISLLGIFAYQAYWLTGLYHTMKQDLEHGIVEAMRMSDYKEMILRIESIRDDEEKHAEVNVSAGYDTDTGKSFIRSSTTVDQESKDSLLLEAKEGKEWVKPDSVQEIMHELETDSDEQYAALRSNGGLDLMLRNQNTMVELASFLQRGIHSGLDIFSDPDITVYDSILTVFLQEKGLNVPHRLERIRTGANIDSTLVFSDTLAIAGDSAYLPSKKALHYQYAFDIHTNHSYRLTLEPIGSIVLRQMSGILATSFVILIILGFSFWFLIRTILKQKTLEEMKSDFTNNITHELKTPIAVAYAANDALLNFNLAEDKKQREKYLNICQEQLQRLSGLVEQILSMSMERRKTFRLHPEELHLREMFPSLIEQHKLKAGKPADITLDIEPEDLQVTADRTHLSNILSNLIDNAIKYSPERADIHIRCRRREAEQVEISVSDHGIGIPADKLANVFDKFYRVPTGNIHNTKGFGLGLFYVKTMVEKHGGSVSVKSEPGRGSTFTICL